MENFKEAANAPLREAIAKGLEAMADTPYKERWYGSEACAVLIEAAEKVRAQEWG